MNQTDHLVFPAYSFLEAGLMFVCRLLNTHLLWEGVPPALRCPPAPHLPSPFLQTLEEGQKKVEATVLSVRFLCCTCYLLASTFLPGTLVFHRQLLICRVYSLQPHTHTHTHTHTLRPDQFSSVTQLRLTLCNSMECSTLGFPVHHQLPELTQTHVHRVGDAIQPSHPLSSPSPPAFNFPLTFTAQCKF